MGNFTNRSPYPTLHLLREVSIDKAVEAFPEADAILGPISERLETLGQAGWDALGVGAAARPGTSSMSNTPRAVRKAVRYCRQPAGGRHPPGRSIELLKNCTS